MKTLKNKNTIKNIIFTGYLDTFKYMKLLSNSIGVIFPSRDEDFGISALDAYNLNIPVIVKEIVVFLRNFTRRL